jgi:TonB family protein
MAYKVYLPGMEPKQTVHFLPLIYCIIALLLAGYLVYQLTGVLALTRRHTIVDEDGHKVVKLTSGTHTFSFFNLVFIPGGISSDAEYKQVVCHELAHVRQFHSLDILLLRIIKIFQWFNPFIYLMETMLKETHEYLADEAVLKQDSDTGQYRLLLLSQVFGIKPGLFSFFNHSLIKNRLKMMTKRKSPMRNRLKYLIVLPFLTLVILIVCCNKSEQLAPPPPPPPPPPPAEYSETPITNAEKVTIDVDQQARFQGGDIENFREWIQKKVVYPPEAIKNGIYGKVIVQFVVDSEGKLGDIKILRGVAPSLDNAALQAIQASPDWVPAKKDGKDIKQQFVIPVYFALQ